MILCASGRADEDTFFRSLDARSAIHHKKRRIWFEKADRADVKWS